MSVQVYHSSKGNNQYIMSPFKIPPQPYCEFINKVYRKYLMHDLKEPVSNFPYNEDETVNLCNLMEKVFVFSDNKYKLTQI